MMSVCLKSAWNVHSLDDMVVCLGDINGHVLFLVTLKDMWFFCDLDGHVVFLVTLMDMVFMDGMMLVKELSRNNVGTVVL